MFIYGPMSKIETSTESCQIAWWVHILWLSLIIVSGDVSPSNYLKKKQIQDFLMKV